MNPTQKHYYEIVEEIVKRGWCFKAYDHGYDKGWWILPDSEDPVKAMRRGDPKGFYQGAEIVKSLYLESEPVAS